MPFTPSHVAAILPLARTRLLPSALVIGSMVPDLPLFTPFMLDYPTTHSLPGVFTADALLGFLAYAIWHGLLAAPTVDALPSKVHAAVTSRTELGLWRRICGLRQCLRLYLSLVIGATTHIVWDAFTHEGRWGVDLVPWLAQQHGPMAGHAYAQHASTVVGAFAIAWWLHRWLRSNDITPQELRVGRSTLTASLVVVLAGTANAMFVVTPRIASNGWPGLDTSSYLVATTAIPGGVTCAAVLAAGWHVQRLRRTLLDL